MPGRQDANCKQGLIERCQDLQKQRRAVESEVQKDGGTCPTCILLRRIWSRSQAILDRIEGWKTEAMRRLFRFKKEEDETKADY